MKTVNARELWQKILETRLNTGEPYLIFADTVNRQMPKHQRDLGLKVTTSNLCSEIMLHTGPDHLGVDRAKLDTTVFPDSAAVRPVEGLV